MSTCFHVEGSDCGSFKGTAHEGFCFGGSIWLNSNPVIDLASELVDENSFTLCDLSVSNARSPPDWL